MGVLDDSDLPWHLATGDWIRDHGIPRSDPFSWTAAGAFWQPNSWLADVLASLAREIGGLATISIGRALVVPVLAVVIFAWCRRQKVPRLPSIATSALLTLALPPFIVVRPNVIGIGLTGMALLMVTRPSTTRSLIAFGLLFAAWSNLHGSVVVGIGVVALAVVGMTIADLSHWNRIRYLLVAIGAALANPYGWSVFTHFFTVRNASSSIDEWQPLALDDSRGITFLRVIIIASAVVTLRRRSEDLVVPLPTLALAVGTVMTVRTAALLLMVSAPLIGRSFEWIGDRIPRERYVDRVHPGIVAVAVAATVLTVSSFGNMQNVGSIGTAFSTDLVDALPSDCRLFNEYTVGGFIIDHAYPDLLVSQDGCNDLYGAEELARQAPIVLTAYTAPLEAWGVNCALIENRRPLASALADDQRWMAAASDPLSTS